MNTFVNILAIICFISIIMFLWYTYRIIKRNYDYIILGDYSVKHRIDDRGIFQYSINGKLWTDMYVFNNDNSHPNLIYFKVNNDEYNEWCNRLDTVAKCHEFNRKEMQLYIKSIKKYLNIDDSNN